MLKRGIACASATILAQADQDRCKFKSEYFSEFDLNPASKIDGEAYNTDDVAKNRDFEFNFCEPLDGFTDKYAVMTIPSEIQNGSDEKVYFGGEATTAAYLDAYNEARLTGSRGEGNVRGVKLTYTSD